VPTPTGRADSEHVGRPPAVAVVVVGQLRSLFSDGTVRLSQRRLMAPLQRDFGADNVFLYLCVASGEADAVRAATRDAWRDSNGVELDGAGQLGAARIAAVFEHRARSGEMRGAACLRDVQRDLEKNGGGAARVAWYVRSRPDLVFFEEAPSPLGLREDTVYARAYRFGGSFRRVSNRALSAWRTNNHPCVRRCVYQEPGLWRVDPKALAAARRRRARGTPVAAVLEAAVLESAREDLARSDAVPSADADPLSGRRTSRRRVAERCLVHDDQLVFVPAAFARAAFGLAPGGRSSHAFPDDAEPDDAESRGRPGPSDPRDAWSRRAETRGTLAWLAERVSASNGRLRAALRGEGGMRLSTLPHRPVHVSGFLDCPWHEGRATCLALNAGARLGLLRAHVRLKRGHDGPQPSRLPDIPEETICGTSAHLPANHPVMRSEFGLEVVGTA
jgi:hypothetical protein